MTTAQIDATYDQLAARNAELEEEKAALVAEMDAAADYAQDHATLIELVAEAIGVPGEPHQGRAERILEAAERREKAASLAERFARAKGRHHSQHAMCDLLEHFGLPCVRPGEESMATCACGDQFPPDSYGAGFMDANGGVCANCAAAEGGDQ